MSSNITRKAVLIASTASGDRFLQSEYDVENVIQHLKSNRGGAWLNDEIKEFVNCSKREILDFIYSLNCDYVFVYFSGHGGTTLSNQRILELKGGELIYDTDLISNSLRQLIAIDACGDRIERHGIGNIPGVGDGFINFDGRNEARELFKHFIEISPAGIIIIHGTQMGSSASDSPKGGMFTQALLEISSNLITPENYCPVLISEIANHIPTYLRQRRNDQIPEIYSEGNMCVPFAFGFQEERQIQRRSIPPLKKPQPFTLSKGEGVFLSVAALFVIAALSSK
jgi:hypothetical protein